MKTLWNSFLQTVIQFVRDLFTGLTKAMHRNAVLMTAGISVVTMIACMAGDLHVGGHNALVAFAETQEYRTEAETELEEADSMELATDKEDAENEFTENEHMNETESVAPTAEDAEETEPVTEAAKTFADMTEEEKMELPGYEEETEAIVEAEKAMVLSDSDYDTLLRIVQAESGGCDIIGKILVANVILNRVDSDEFPNSIHGVVYQKSQFSPVIDGSINRCKVSEETREAVERALNGEDPSEGALYFMNRSRSAAKNVRWFDTKLSFLFKHGEHEFFK
ncbi:MAG: cell wall hydrolase [Lachnospiraceae bacterium]|nr:cell wall hydrolase [Lachnospiraceae bacterium]